LFAGWAKLSDDMFLAEAIVVSHRKRPCPKSFDKIFNLVYSNEFSALKANQPIKEGN